MLMEKFDIQVDEDTITQLTFLHSNIPGYDLPAINFVSPSEEDKKATYSKNRMLEYLHT